jgi:hypothetical protein
MHGGKGKMSRGFSLFWFDCVMGPGCWCPGKPGGKMEKGGIFFNLLSLSVSHAILPSGRRRTGMNPLLYTIFLSRRLYGLGRDLVVER